MRWVWLLLTTVFLLLSQHVDAAEKGLFWQLESPSGQVSYLFGTMHTDDNRVTNFPPSVIQALKNVDTFMLEVADAPPASLLQLPQGNLKQYLSETELEQVARLADMHVMPMEMVLRMKPWLLAVLFDLPKPQTPFAQDLLLKAKAEELDKRVLGLESPQEHFGVMDNLTTEEQLQMLRTVLKRSQKQKENDFERLMKAYLAGDAEQVANMDDAMTQGVLPAALWQRMRVKLLDERNVLMAERSLEQAKQGRVFIAVGAAHLAGKDGLINTFRQAGFKLTPLKK
ncbi:TraB/GumN family protein [Methylophilus sp. TWE2]|uniref:TraB/GumN family protein n=1 Tax=Methylophilus sp. TWE2 TaxID=1662285 RepID=UPI00067130FB|nr:TraB/GumN family protein [Methylophilus sp. TWE2]AKR43818.1 polysaccharide biosynthesis protein GumN [Methylophilus sp. TWE2]